LELGASGPEPAARLALCGNVFPAESVVEARAVFEGPLAQLASACQAQPFPRPGFGLYLAAAAIAELDADAELRAAFQAQIRQSGWSIWTANAFPFGGFHGKRVKEKAFLPDWRTAERADFSFAVARFLAELMAPGERGSVSTCPLGYGSAAREDAASLGHLEKLAAGLDELAKNTGVDLVLALEPEPEGGFERVPDLAEWLAEHLAHPRIGICWDLCHSAVVGESAEEVLQALRATGTPLGKVQVSAALQTEAGFGTQAEALLRLIAEDRYFHQARAFGANPQAWADLPELVAESAWPARLGLATAEHELRVHCHVPLHRTEFAPGLVSTDWRSMLSAAQQAGCRDFEVETYTLPVLPEQILIGGATPLDRLPVEQRLVAIMAEELQVAASQIGLDTAAPDP
jgi:sugar phosphate isomerase/epimerase